MHPEPKILNGTVWTLVVVNVAALVVSFLFAWITFDLLPERYPVHFGLNGQPNRWAAGSSSEWFAIPIIAFIMAAPMVGLALGVHKIPIGQWSLPHKEAFAALPRERQAPVIRTVAFMVLVLSAVNTLLLLLLHMAMFRSSTTLLGPPMWPMWIVGIFYAALLTGWIVRLFQVTKRAVDSGPADS